MRDRKDDDVLISDESVILTDFVAASRRADRIDTFVIGPATDIETEPIVTV